MQIGVNWCVEWGTYWNVHTRKHSTCKKFNTIKLQVEYGKRMFVREHLFVMEACGKFWQRWKIFTKLEICEKCMDIQNVNKYAL